MRSPPNGTFCHSDLEASNNDFLQVLSLSLSIRSSSWIYIIIITITILIIHFNITMFIKGVRRLDFGNWWLKPKKWRLLLWRRKCNNCTRYLWWISKIWKHTKNMLEIWVSELTAEGGPHMVLVTTDEGVRYSDGTFLEPTASLADKVWQPVILIFWYSNILAFQSFGIPIFWYCNVLYPLLSRLRWWYCSCCTGCPKKTFRMLLEPLCARSITNSRHPHCPRKW